MFWIDRILLNGQLYDDSLACHACAWLRVCMRCWAGGARAQARFCWAGAGLTDGAVAREAERAPCAVRPWRLGGSRRRGALPCRKRRFQAVFPP